MALKSYYIKRAKKRLSKGLKRSIGRTAKGGILVKGKVQGLKKYLRIVNYNRWLPYQGKIVTLLKFRSHTAYLGYVNYDIGYVGCVVLSSVHEHLNYFVNFGTGDLNEGEGAKLKNIKLGSYVHLIERNIGEGAKINRAAGTFSVLYSVRENYALLKSKSGWLLKLNNENMGVVGRVSNKWHSSKKLKKASDSLKQGRKSKVRGVAMNPVDHPHGGGEGKKNPKVKKSPWGWLTSNFSTIRNKKYLLKKKALKDRKVQKKRKKV